MYWKIYKHTYQDVLVECPATYSTRCKLSGFGILWNLWDLISYVIFQCRLL